MEIEFSVRITEQEAKQQLYASSLFGCTALLLAIFFSLFIPVLTSFLIGFALLTSYLAFRPFFKVRAQQKTPDRLAITHQRLIFYINNKKAVSIPLKAIERVSFDEGIVLFLKKPVLEPIEVLDAKLLSNRKKGDFFFEWFEPNVLAILAQEIKNLGPFE